MCITRIPWSSGIAASRKTGRALPSFMTNVFCRMWEFYLISAETMFRTGAQMVFHMQLARTREAAMLTRDYIFQAEEAYRRSERHSTAA